jgi:hypothetical protein
MVDKNLVDDYYSKISSDTDVSGDESDVKKVLIKAKKKLIVKKVDKKIEVEDKNDLVDENLSD